LRGRRRAKNSMGELGEVIMSEQEIYQAACAEWTGEVARLWVAAGRPVDDGQLRVYVRELGTIPLGLLEMAVSRAIRDNSYANVPSIGSVWSALRRELGNPYDVRLAIGEWIQASAARCVLKFGVEVRNDVPAVLD
jgi:hypothetical protein